jgi:hypothetical protein
MRPVESPYKGHCPGKWGRSVGSGVERRAHGRGNDERIRWCSIFWCHQNISALVRGAELRELVGVLFEVNLYCLSDVRQFPRRRHLWRANLVRKRQVTACCGRRWRDGVHGIDGLAAARLASRVIQAWYCTPGAKGTVKLNVEPNPASYKNGTV